MAYGWEGEKARLVPLDRERHLENAVRWLNDPEVTAWTLVGDLPLTRLAEEGFFTRQSTDAFAGTQTDITFAVERPAGPAPLSTPASPPA